MSNIFNVFYSLLSNNNRNKINISEIYLKTKNTIHTIEINPIRIYYNIFIKNEINNWYDFNCPLIPSNTSLSFMHEKTNINFSSLYLHSIETLKNIIYSNITCDGTYLYIFHRKFGVFKIGTGYNNTICGKIYKFTLQCLYIISMPGLLSNNVNTKGLGNAQINK